MNLFKIDRLFLPLALTLLLPSLHAQELSPFHQRELAKARKYVEGAEQIHARDPRSSTFQFKFQMADRTLKRLPAEHPEVKALLVRLAQIDPNKAKAPKTPPPATQPSRTNENPPTGNQKTEEKPPASTKIQGLDPEETQRDIVRLKEIEDRLSKITRSLSRVFRKEVRTEKGLRESPQFQALRTYLHDKENGMNKDFTWLRDRFKHYSPLLPQNQWRQDSPLRKRLRQQVKETSSQSRVFAPRIRTWMKAQEDEIARCLKYARSEAEKSARKDKPSSTGKTRSGRQKPGQSETKQKPETSKMAGWIEQANEHLENLRTLLGEKHEATVRCHKMVSTAEQEIAQIAGAMRAKYADDLVQKIDRALAKIEAGVQKGVSEKKLWILKSTSRSYGTVERYVSTLTGYVGPDDPRTRKAAKKLQTSQDQFRATMKSLENDLAADAKAPADRYTGKEMEALRKLALDTYRKRYPKDEILAVRMAEETWDRKQSKEWNSAISKWQYWDYSELIFAVIVRVDDTYAYVYPGSFHRDHMKGDRTTVATGSREGKGGLVAYKILLSKVNSN